MSDILHFGNLVSGDVPEEPDELGVDLLELFEVQKESKIVDSMVLAKDPLAVRGCRSRSFSCDVLRGVDVTGG